MIFGYCRISTSKQNLERQIRNILAVFPDAKIYTETYTGTKFQGRQELEKILNKVKQGDTIVFDSVSRMSRNAEEGIKLYMELYRTGINLFFLKEQYINTDTYRDALQNKIQMTGGDEDIILDAINKYLTKLAERQIKIAFEQAQKEVDDLHKRTSEGVQIAKHNGKQVGQKQGNKLNIKKSAPAKEIIRKHNKDFGGTLTNEETWKLAGISKMTFYKYKKEIIEDIKRGI